MVKGIFSKYIPILFIWLLAFTVWLPAIAEPPPPITLANVYKEGVELNRYWVSEKLDGVRAYWNGQQLISRQGNVYHAPPWFVAGFPSQPLDGELWIARGAFERVVSTVRKQMPEDDEWKHVRYMVFDLPGADGPFSRRLADLQQLFETLDSPYATLVTQYRLDNHESLMNKLNAVVALGGEGLMLRRDDSLYDAGRSNDLLKVKTFDDAEARVIAHLPGQGKYHGMLGALLVELPDGKRFRIGTGFSDEERSTPPPVGSLVTYKFYGTTRNGLPRFASFLRIRESN